jgi:hypothetical protein
MFRRIGKELKRVGRVTRPEEKTSGISMKAR